MKRILLIATIAAALAATGLVSAPLAGASGPGLTIGPTTGYTATSNPGSVSIVDPCIGKRWYTFNGYWAWGGFCTDYGYWKLVTYHGYDQYNRFVGYVDCWSTPVYFYGCNWR